MNQICINHAEEDRLTAQGPQRGVFNRDIDTTDSTGFPSVFSKYDGPGGGEDGSSVRLPTDRFTMRFGIA